MGEKAESSNCIQLNQQIDQAFPIFLAVNVEKYWKDWVQGYLSFQTTSVVQGSPAQQNTIANLGAITIQIRKEKVTYS